MIGADSTWQDIKSVWRPTTKYGYIISARRVGALNWYTGWSVDCTCDFVGECSHVALMTYETTTLCHVRDEIRPTWNGRNLQQTKCCHKTHRKDYLFWHQWSNHLDVLFGFDTNVLFTALPSTRTSVKVSLKMTLAVGFWVLKRPNRRLGVLVGFHTILRVDTVWGGHFIQISRRASKNATDFSYGKNPAGNRWSRR
jgi:hypothetical protein